MYSHYYSVRKTIKKTQQINEDITFPEIRVIDENGEQLGLMKSEDALKEAHSRGLDLVLVAIEAKPPVCRFQDFDKLRYEKKRHIEKSRKKSKKQEVKEIRLTPNTSPNDIMVKVKHARKFLISGDKVKALVKFVGREITHPELGNNVLAIVKEELLDIAEIDLAPKFEGKRLTMTFRPKEK